MDEPARKKRFSGAISLRGYVTTVLTARLPINHAVSQACIPDEKLELLHTVASITCRACVWDLRSVPFDLYELWASILAQLGSFERGPSAQQLRSCHSLR